MPTGYPVVERVGRQRGNPKWGQQGKGKWQPPAINSFDLAVKAFKLEPEQYERSVRLKAWAKQNMNSKYVPEYLLTAWGLVLAVDWD